MPLYFKRKSKKRKWISVQRYVRDSLLKYYMGYQNFFHSKSDIISILVSYAFCNKLPQNWWLQTIDIYSLTLLQVKSPTSSCQQGHPPAEGFREESFIASSSFWWLLHDSNLCSIFTWPSFPCFFINFSFSFLIRINKL